MEKNSLCNGNIQCSKEKDLGAAISQEVLVSLFDGISTFVVYLMPKPSL